MYFLAIIAGFFLGLVYAAITEAGKGQMLAAGAIVFFHGLIGAFIGLCLSLFAAFKVRRDLIIKINVVLALVIVTSFAYFYVKYQKRQREKLENEPFKQEQPKTPKKTVPAGEAMQLEGSQTTSINYNKGKSLTVMSEKGNLDHTGLGMFIPNFHENKTLYFYGNPTLGKGVMEHSPTDSITFKKSQYGGFEIATAPPWLVPDHLKLDYDMLYFKVQSITHDFIEITVNTTTNQTSFVDRYSGKLLYWPEFLMQINSVEFPDPESHFIYNRPFETSGKQNQVPNMLMRPIRIKNEWMQVELLGDDFKVIGNGWIRWMENGKLLVNYSLLS